MFGSNISFIHIIILIVVVSLTLKVWGSFSEYFKWKRLPRMSEYLSANPQCRTSRGIKCVVCNASSIRNWGLTSQDDTDRVFICNHCGTKLYRN